MISCNYWIHFHWSIERFCVWPLWTLLSADYWPSVLGTFISKQRSWIFACIHVYVQDVFINNFIQVIGSYSFIFYSNLNLCTSLFLCVRSSQPSPQGPNQTDASSQGDGVFSDSLHDLVITELSVLTNAPQIFSSAQISSVIDSQGMRTESASMGTKYLVFCFFVIVNRISTKRDTCRVLIQDNIAWSLKRAVAIITHNMGPLISFQRMWSCCCLFR